MYVGPYNGDKPIQFKKADKSCPKCHSAMYWDSHWTVTCCECFYSIYIQKSVDKKTKNNKKKR